jgi:DtxR family Mn-dependent transcriptional regulator
MVGRKLHYAYSSLGETALLAQFSPGALLLAGLVLILALAVLLAPRWGILARLRESRRLRARVCREDALKHLLAARIEGFTANLHSLAGAMGTPLGMAAETLANLQASGLLTLHGTEPCLTPEGERYALNIIRAHRLWELHLAERTGVAEKDWHREADRQEHFISPHDADLLFAGLGHPSYDPHGDPIPNGEGEIPHKPAKPLSTIRPAKYVQVTHIEDEPEQVYAQIRAIGICPGAVLRIVENSPERVRLWNDGEEHVLAPVVAANVFVLEQEAPVSADNTHSTPLSALRAGQDARVIKIAQRCRGAERRRLMDLGILPGTVIVPELSSPTGKLKAYRVRDALIGLREEQADLIHVTPLS